MLGCSDERLELELMIIRSPHEELGVFPKRGNLVERKLT
jgi:carbonic anhydrase